MAVSLAASFLRAWRYRILLQPVEISPGGHPARYPGPNAFDDLFPARIGSLLIFMS